MSAAVVDVTGEEFIFAHYEAMTRNPSNLADCAEVLRLVKAECADTSWIESKDLPHIAAQRVRYAKAVQLEILKAAGLSVAFGCGVVVEVTVGAAPLTLPPMSYFWSSELPSLFKVRGIIGKMHRGGGCLPGDNMAAAALLLQAAAELERGIECPAGFGKRLALSK